jgi:hypothetical protein
MRSRCREKAGWARLPHYGDCTESAWDFQIWWLLIGRSLCCRPKYNGRAANTLCDRWVCRFWERISPFIIANACNFRICFSYLHLLFKSWINNCNLEDFISMRVVSDRNPFEQLPKSPFLVLLICIRLFHNQ